MLKIKLRGLGSEEEIEGLKSTKNILETHGLKSNDHMVYIILDQSFNLSSHIGIPVNGIIGHKFLKIIWSKSIIKKENCCSYQQSEISRKTQ